MKNATFIHIAALLSLSGLSGLACLSRLPRLHRRLGLLGLSMLVAVLLLFTVVENSSAVCHGSAPAAETVSRQADHRMSASSARSAMSEIVSASSMADRTVRTGHGHEHGREHGLCGMACCRNSVRVTSPTGDSLAEHGADPLLAGDVTDAVGGCCAGKLCFAPHPDINGLNSSGNSPAPVAGPMLVSASLPDFSRNVSRQPGPSRAPPLVVVPPRLLYCVLLI